MRGELMKMRRAREYQDHETRLAIMESYFQNMRMPSSGDFGGQPSSGFLQDLLGGTTTARHSSYVGHSSQMSPPQFPSTMDASGSAFHTFQPTYAMASESAFHTPATTTQMSGFAGFISNIFDTGPSMQPPVTAQGFQTPMSPVPSMQPEAPMGRGFRQRKQTAVHESPFTQLPDTTPHPKKAKGKGKDGGKSGKENQMVTLYKRDEISNCVNLTCLPHESVDRKWWEILLGLDSKDWFLESHIQAWVRLVNSSRASHQDWTVMIPDFWEFMSRTHGGPKYAVTVCNVQMANEGFPARSTIRRVILPICIDDKHWVTGELNIRTMQMTIYDTLQGRHLIDALMLKMNTFRSKLVSVFIALGDPNDAVAAGGMTVTVPEATPRQTGILGDCGPWVCRYISELTGAGDLQPVTDPKQAMLDFRYKMAETFWRCRRI